ncbi:MAG: porin family protein [Bacteroidia bacterium]
MKKFKISILLLLLSGACLAQQTTTTTTDEDCGKVTLGFIFLPTVTKVDVHQQDNGNVKSTAVIGYSFGGYLGYNFNRHVGVQMEVLYSKLSQKFTDDANREHRLDLSYINIPLLLTLNTNVCKKVNFNIVGGPQVGIRIGSKLTTEDGAAADTVQAVVSVKPLDLGIAYGAGFDFAITDNVNFGVGFRGVYGILDISDNSQTATTNQYYILDRSKVRTYGGYLSIGFKF